MDVVKAKQIVDGYKAIIAKGAVGETVLRKISWLPHPTAMIKFAFYTLIEDLISKGDLDSDTRKALVDAYSILGYFVSDDLADKYSRNFEAWRANKSDPMKTKRDENLIKQYLAYVSTLRLRSEELRGEIEGFVAEISKS